MGPGNRISRSVPVSPDPILDPERLAAVGEILPDKLSDAEFDRLTILAARVLAVPACTITLVTAETQEFKGACGMPGDLATTRSTPLSHSFCKYTVLSGELLQVSDAPSDSRVSDNPAISDAGVMAYLGFPLVNKSGHVLGAFCLIDFVPREWTPTEIDSVRDFAGLALDLIESAARESKTVAERDVLTHDLRSPLSSISLSSAILKEQARSIPENLRGLVDGIVVSTDDAVKLLDSYTDMDGRKEAATCGDPCAVLDSVVARLRPAADRKAMELVSTKKGCRAISVSPWVLERILENLVSNALKYSPPGTTVWLSYESDGESGWFTVRDEGPGFSEADLPDMFRRYIRLSAKPTGDENSTGIGLSIVKRLAGQNGGTLDLTSRPGEAAEFRLGFPLHLETRLPG